MERIRTDRWFESCKKDYYSQNGEDGILEQIFASISHKNKFVVECGALNGVKDSNARHLIAEMGWSGLLIEADLTAFEKLTNNYKDYSKAKCANRFVSFEEDNTFDAIFKEYDVPQDFDLFVLDIDGNEYHVWEAMTAFRPRVMVVEFNPTVPNSVSFVQPKDMSIQQGSSLRALKELGERKGYQIVALTDYNVFFVRKDDTEPFSCLSSDLDVLRPDNPFETKLFQLYDGTLKIAGNKNLVWHQKPIDEEKLQVLPRSQRIFLNGLNSNQAVRNLKHIVRKTPIYSVVKFVRKNPLIRRIIK